MSEIAQNLGFLGGFAFGLIVATLLFLIVLGIGAARGGGGAEIVRALDRIGTILSKKP